MAFTLWVASAVLPAVAAFTFAQSTVRIASVTSSAVASSVGRGRVVAHRRPRTRSSTAWRTTTARCSDGGRLGRLDRLRREPPERRPAIACHAIRTTMSGCRCRAPIRNAAVPNGRRVESIRARPSRTDRRIRRRSRAGTLLRRAGRGDQAAFGELFDELSPMVHGVVLQGGPRPVAGRGSRPGGVRGAVAPGGPLRRDEGLGPLVGGHAGAPPGDRPGAQRAGIARPAGPGRRTDACRHTTCVVAEVEASLDQARVRRALAQPQRAATRGRRAGLLRWAHLPRSRRAARRRRRNREEPNPRRSDPAARRTGR